MKNSQMIAPDNWEPTADDNLTRFMAGAWNRWFRRWRDRAATATDAEWDQLLEEGDAVLASMGGGDTPAAIMRALLYELDARYKKAH